MKQTFKPHIIKQSEVRTCWAGVVGGSAWAGPPGINYLSDEDGTQPRALERSLEPLNAPNGNPASGSRLTDCLSGTLPADG